MARVQVDEAYGGLEALINVGVLRRFPARSIIITEGDLGSSMYIILKGRVKIFTSDIDGKEFIFANYGPGEIVGEMALDGGARSASVEALTELLVSIIPIEVFRDKVRADADFAMSLIRALVQRGRVATAHARNLALSTVYHRVVGLLRQHAINSDGREVVREGFSQQSIADRVGASRDMISKIFKELVKGGYISYSRKEIVLLKPMPARW